MMLAVKSFQRLPYVGIMVIAVLVFGCGTTHNSISTPNFKKLQIAVIADTLIDPAAFIDQLEAHGFRVVDLTVEPDQVLGTAQTARIDIVGVGEISVVNLNCWFSYVHVNCRVTALITK